MLTFRLKDIGFRTSVLIPSLLMGLVIACLSWWLYSDQKNDEATYQSQRVTRVDHLQIATDFGIHLWQARVALIMTWSNPRDLDRVASAERMMEVLREESNDYKPQSESGQLLKQTVPLYIAQSKIMFDYFRTVDKAVKYGVVGSGNVYREYALHISNGVYDSQWEREALTAVNHLQAASLYYNGFVAGMRINYLENAINNIDAAVTILAKNPSDSATAKAYEAAKRYQKAMEMLDKDINAYHNAHRSSIEIGAQLNKALTELQNRLGEQGFHFADERLLDSKEKNNLLITLLIASLVLALVIALIVVRSMSAQLQFPLLAAQAIGNRDLSLSFVDDGQNEFGELSRSIDSMRLNIKDVLGKIIESSAQLSSSSEEVSAISVQSSANMRSQQEQLDSLSAAMEEMRTTSADIAQNAESSAHATSSAANNAQVGGEAIDETVVAIRSVEQEMTITTDSIRQLVDESQRIGSIVDVINAIADQTNLLALNAAIEAARAGEQGRGFAVVADEVRSLATRTQDSTGEIGNIIKRLQEQAVAAEMTMTESVAKMSKGVEAVNRSGDVIREMNLSVSEIFDMSSQIASATEQQTAVSEELGGNVLRITQAASEVTEGAVQTTQACEDLSSLANQLHVMTSQFKL